MKEFDELVKVMARLRGKDGCPWDREQTHASIRKYVIEEAYEVAEAIDGDNPTELRTELGDLLLQVVFHARMAEEVGDFDIAGVCETVTRKLERRHPHVFGGLEVADAHEVARNWEAIKAGERGAGASVLDGVPRALPSLQRAERLADKASQVGFDWPAASDVLEKLDEERAELAEALRGDVPERIAEEIGDVLLTVGNLARKLGFEPELTLGKAVDRFEARFRYLERRARSQGENLEQLSPSQLERRWQDAKRALAREAVSGD